MRSREPRVQAATTRRRPSAGPALGLAAELVEHVDARTAARRGGARAAPLWANTGPGRPPPSMPGASSGRANGREREQRPPGQHGVPAGAVEIQPRRRHRAVRHLAVARRQPAGLVVVGDHFQPGGQHLVGLVVEAARGARDIVEQRLHALVEQRHPVLHARVPPPVGDREVDRVVGGAGPEQLAPGGRGTGRPLSRSSDTSRHRPQGDAVSAARRCAGWRGRRRGCFRSCRRTGRGAPDRAAPDGKDVDDAAAHGVFARLHDGAGAAVAVGVEEARELVRIDAAVRPPARGWRRGRRAAAARAAPAR